MFQNRVRQILTELLTLPLEKAIEAAEQIEIDIVNFVEDLRSLDAQGWRERQRIKRKASRWLARLRRMPLAEQKAVMAALSAADLHAENDEGRNKKSRS